MLALDINQKYLDDLKATYPNIIPVAVDLSQWDETRKIVEGLGPIHHLVNNAGIFLHEPVLEITEQTVDK